MPGREDDDVGREAVAAEVGRLPEPIGLEVRREGVEHRPPEPRAAGVAAAVTTDEDERPADRLGGVEVEAGHVGEPG